MGKHTSDNEYIMNMYIIQIMNICGNEYIVGFLRNQETKKKKKDYCHSPNKKQVLQQ